MTYECTICHAVNTASRLHCKACGTIPARYSWMGKPIKLTSQTSQDWPHDASIEVVIAWGAMRADQCRTARVNLRRVADDYYAWE